MGLDCAAAKFLCAAKMAGADFSDTLMIGRQMYLVEAPSLAQIAATLGLQFESLAPPTKGDWSEWFFRLLGARNPCSLDGSSHEGATFVQNLNKPVASNLLQRFSVVFDGGTLEHVFNVPQALKNCLDMVRLDGHYLVLTVANNFMGHGLWQFSPDLFFRVLSPENGFQLEAVLLHEVLPNGSWHIVLDPRDVLQRVELNNTTPTYILAIAKRVEYKPIFDQFPVQSDYSSIWAGNAANWGAGPWGEWDNEGYSFSAKCYLRISDGDLLAGRFSKR